MKTDTAQVKAYLNIHITGKLTPTITDPVHLRQELLQINKQLPTRLSLPGGPPQKYLALLKIPDSEPNHPWQ